MKYSVIMPVYNVEDYLEESVGCIIDQTCRDWELFLINDGSSDKSGQICDQLAQSDSRIKVIHQENKGSGAARQAGLNMAQGDYIVFCDPDDRIEVKALEENGQVIDRYQPDIIFNGYTQKTLDAKAREIIREHNYQSARLMDRGEFIENFAIIEEVSAKAIWCKVYRREFLVENSISFSDQRLGQDALFNYLAYKFVQSAYISPKSYYIYDNTRPGSAVNRYNPDRGSFMLNIAKSYEEMVEYWGARDLHSDKIHREYWQAIYTQAQNLSRLDCDLSMSEKVSKLEKMRNIDRVDQMFSNLDTKYLKGKMPKLIYKLLKNHKIKLSLFIQNLHNKYKQKQKLKQKS